jgi:peptide chain release factor subunit 1
MDSERLRPLLTAPGPFASVYFEDSHDSPDAGAQLELRWRGLREQLEELGAEESVTADMERAVLGARPPIGRSGRGVVAGADITVHVDGKVRSETVDAPDGDPQLRTEEAASKNLRAVADRVEELLGDAGAEAVFVIGEMRSRSDFLATVPHQVRALAVELQVGARHSGHNFDEAQQAIESELLKRRLAVIDDAAQRFSAEVGRQSGLAAEGLGPVCSGLRQGAVDTLIIGEIGEETVVADDELTTVAPTAEVLSEQGAAASRTLRADEALPLFAVAVGASLVRTDERIAPADGVGAVLRYAPTLH